MKANLPTRANWGPWMAVLGVLLALITGVVLGVPALVVGSQSGGVERLSPSSSAAPVEIEDEDSYAIAPAPGGRTIYTDRGDEAAGLDRGGDTVQGSPFGDFSESRGLALARGGGGLYVSDRDDGTIQRFRLGGTEPEEAGETSSDDLPADLGDDFEPGRIATAGSGALFVIDRGNEAVERFSPSGRYLGELDPSASPAGEFDFDGAGEKTGVAVGPASGAAAGRGAENVYLVGERPGGESALWAFDTSGKFLWELPQSDRLDPCGVAVDGSGHLWVADDGDGAVELSGPRRPHSAPVLGGRRVAAGRDACDLAFSSDGDLYLASAPPPLTSAADALVQLATALGFLLVPFAIAAGSGATVREAAGMLGLRRPKLADLKWMAAAVGAYLVLTAAYVAIFGNPEQKDIAEGFGALPIQVLLIVIIAPISEEVCFRGMLFGGLRTRMPAIAAALISGFIFGGLHITTGISAVPPLMIFGFILALLYEKTGSIVPGIILHMLNNVIALSGQ